MKTLLLLALLTVTTPCLANIFVGNGGDGVEMNGKLYLRDLVNLNLQTSPYFGAVVDSDLPELPAHKAIRFSYPEQLLARKLTDLNRAAPGIGDFLAASMKLYTWTLEDYPLTPISDPGNTVRIPPGAKVVQIANRLGTAIRIHSGSWNRLDDENKVALLIHEAVYSLVRPVRADDHTFFQPEHTAQEITGAFFDPSFYFRAATEIYADLKNNLEIPDTMLPLNSVRQPASWRFAFGQGRPGTSCTGSAALCSKAGTVIDFKNRNQSYLLLSQSLTTACHRIESLRTPADKSIYWMRSEFVPRPLDIQLGQFRASLEENVPFQTYVSLHTQATAPSVVDYIFVNASGCTGAFMDHLNAASESLW